VRPYDILKKDGYRVSIVQQLLTGLANDVAVGLGRVSPGFEAIRSRCNTCSIFMSRNKVSQRIAIVGFVSHYH
jgi:hypothetical protein